MITRRIFPLLIRLEVPLLSDINDSLLFMSFALEQRDLCLFNSYNRLQKSLHMNSFSLKCFHSVFTFSHSLIFELQLFWSLGCWRVSVCMFVILSLSVWGGWLVGFFFKVAELRIRCYMQYSIASDLLQ